MEKKDLSTARFSSLLVTAFGFIIVIGSFFMLAGALSAGVEFGLSADMFTPFVALFIPGLILIGVGAGVDLLATLVVTNERIIKLIEQDASDQ